NYGDLLVTSQVTGYKKINIYTREVMGEYNLDMPVVQLRTTGTWISINEELIENLRLAGKWNSSKNDYGPRWDKITQAIRRRDSYRCQSCGSIENGPAFHVHHKTPLRCFNNIEEANRFENLITLCPACHKKAEAFVKVRSGINGLRYAMQSLSPLFLMCDTGDIGTLSESESNLNDGLPAIVIYDMVAGGIGLSQQFYKIYHEIMDNIYEMINSCSCFDGCPSCVGPGGESGSGGKQEALAILELMGY
ncbi:MAG: DUF1998 domain-containing protein, partial [Anaerolineae bacterium]|nr:DUF1998 domain-containing protein [Anaerolineae bacterium]